MSSQRDKDFNTLRRIALVAYDPARAALTLLCVLVVAFAASLFPATGFGAYPTSADGGGGPADDPLDWSGSDPDLSDPAPSTATPTPTPESTATATPTPETTDETTSAAGSTHPSGGGGDLAVAIFGVGIALLLGVLGFLFVPLGNGLTVAGIELPALQMQLRSIVAAVPRRTMTFVVGLSASVPSLLDSLGGLVAEVGSSLGVVATGVGRAALGSTRLFTAGLSSLFVSLPRAFGGGLFSIAGSLSRVGGSFGRGPARDEESTDDDSPPATPVSDPEEATPPSTVEEVWAAMVDLVPIRNHRSATPRDYARAAIDAGFPSTAVQQLTATFEEVRYGGRPSTTDRLRAARSALRRILDGGDAE